MRNYWIGLLRKIFFFYQLNKLPDHTPLFQELHQFIMGLNSFISSFINGMGYALFYVDGVVEGDSYEIDRFYEILKRERSRIINQESKTLGLKTWMDNFRHLVYQQLRSFQEDGVDPSAEIRKVARDCMSDSNKWRYFRDSVCRNGGIHPPNPPPSYIEITANELNCITTENQSVWVNSTLAKLGVISNELEGIRDILPEASIRSIEQAVPLHDKALLEFRIMATRNRCEAFKEIMESYLIDYLQDMIMRGCW